MRLGQAAPRAAAAPTTRAGLMRVPAPRPHPGACRSRARGITAAKTTTASSSSSSSSPSTPPPPRSSASARPHALHRRPRSRLAALGDDGGISTSPSSEGLYPFDERDYHRVEFMPEPYGPLLYSRDNPARGPKAVVVLRRRRPPPMEAAEAAAAAAAAAAEAEAAAATAAADAASSAPQQQQQQQRPQHLEPRLGVPFFDPPDVDPPPGAGDERDEARRRVRWQKPPPAEAPAAAAAAPAPAAPSQQQQQQQQQKQQEPPPPLSPRPSAAHDFGLEYPDQAASFRQMQHQQQQPPPPPSASAASAAFLPPHHHDDPTLDEPAEEEEQLALEVFISGDSAVQLYCLVNGAPSERPMALDLLWQVWRRAAAEGGECGGDESGISGSGNGSGGGQNPTTPSPKAPTTPTTKVGGDRWGLVRAAIVELRAEVYIARLFFGDTKTGAVVWDADCRPSDACYLVLRTGAPMYVSRGVWRACAQRLRETEAFASIEHVRRVEEAQRAESASRAAAGGGGNAPRGAAATTATTADLPGPDPDALPAVQLLRRELEVAVAEENYAAAAALRDHPLMRLCEDIRFYRAIGYGDAAQGLFDRLSAATEGGARLVAAAVAEARLARAAGGAASSSGEEESAADDDDEEAGEGGRGARPSRRARRVPPPPKQRELE